MSNTFSLPSRTSLQYSECFYVKPDLKDFNASEDSFLRKITKEANNLRLQYFSIEDELINSFKYVSPITKNLDTSSVKFASIIRESSNLYEQVSRIIYSKIYVSNSRDRIDIFDYLKLDIYLKLNDIEFHSPHMAKLSDENPSLLEPFNLIKSWDKSSNLNSSNIPEWWTAYNKIKHSPDKLSQFSTLENAIKSLLASFIIISRYLGPGVVSGALLKPEKKGSQINQSSIPVKQSELFIETETLINYVL